MKKSSKYFKHYKNKPYRYVGEAKHSEELKDYVIYECLYPNDLATLWIRPKDMFFEVSEFQGKTTPRFAQVPFEVKMFSEASNDLIISIAHLAKKYFTDFDQEKFNDRIKSQKNLAIFCFYYDQEFVGFKIGYELNKTSFYSWMGAVEEKYRKLGVATALTEHQHQWVKSQGYKYIETKSDNRFKEMMMLNLKSGFNIIGTEFSELNSVLKIVFQKKL